MFQEIYNSGRRRFGFINLGPYGSSDGKGTKCQWGLPGGSYSSDRATKGDISKLNLILQNVLRDSYKSPVLAPIDCCTDITAIWYKSLKQQCFWLS